MSCNLGSIDRSVRIFVGAVLLLTGTLGWIHGAWGVTLGIIGAVLAFTAVIRFCPIYRVFGLTTCTANPEVS